MRFTKMHGIGNDYVYVNGFAEKVADIVGLYLDPPGGAVVLSIDEKTQIQALDRTQPSDRGRIPANVVEAYEKAMS